MSQVGVEEESVKELKRSGDRTAGERRVLDGGQGVIIIHIQHQPAILSIYLCLCAI